jgi:hypothetical protein
LTTDQAEEGEDKDEDTIESEVKLTQIHHAEELPIQVPIL